MAKSKKQSGGAPAKYSSKFAERLGFFRNCPDAITHKGIISETRVAELFGVSRETVRRWHKLVPDFEDYYHADFAAVWDELQEKVDCSEIKRSMVTKAKGFTQQKIVRELRAVGPEMPPLSKLNKAQKLEYAEKELNLKLEKRMETKAIDMAIRDEVRKQTKEKMIIVKREAITQAGSEAAAQLVLANIGPENERWISKQQHNHSGKLDITEITDEERQKVHQIACEVAKQEINNARKQAS